MEVLQRRQRTEHQGLGVLPLFGLGSQTGILSPYFQTTETRRRRPSRDIRLFLLIMAKKAIISGFINQVNGDSVICNPVVNYYDTATDLSVEINTALSILISDGNTAEEFYSSAVAAALSYGNSQGYGLTAQDIYWAAGSPLLSRSFANPSRSLNSAFQISTTRDASVSYSARIANALSLAGGAAGDVILEYADNSGMSTNVVEVSRFGNSNTGTLVVGLALNDAIAGVVSGVIPAGKYVRLRTSNTTGTPTYTYLRAQEVLL